MSPLQCDRDTTVATLANGVHVVTIRLPHLDTVSVSVYVRSGSRNESPRLNGISHVVEHMAFKGTHERSCQQINLDAERLGAEVNAYTDKDHTAFQIHGLARHTGQFLQMLGDIVRHARSEERRPDRRCRRAAGCARRLGDVARARVAACRRHPRDRDARGPGHGGPRAVRHACRRRTRFVARMTSGKLPRAARRARCR